MKKGPVIILRMANSCNLNCIYCYDKNNHDTFSKADQYFQGKMEKCILYIKKIIDGEKGTRIIFHGGEPLLVKASTYEEFILKLLNIDSEMKFSIQTNGTLLTEEHIDVFKKYNVQVGISLDGFNEMLNRYRVYANGINSFDTVMKKINLLKKKKVRFGLIMTISKEVVGHEQELYDFIAKNDLNCNIRPIFACNDMNENVMTNDEYYTFFTRMFEIWINDQKKVKLRQISEMYDEFAHVLETNYKNRTCSSSGKCFENFISLDCEGELYSCNRTYNNKIFYYGNIEDITASELREKRNERANRRNQAILESKCVNCELFKECRGGCPANAYSLHACDNKSEDYFCEAKLKIRNYVKTKIEEMNLKIQYEEGKKTREK